MREKTTALILLATLAGFGCDDGAVITDSGVTTGDGGGGDCPADGVVVSGEIDADTRWECPLYVLDGRVFVVNGATLSIAAGTEILGDPGASETSALIVAQGAQIDAQGTADAPIVFTSGNFEGDRVTGDWAGVAMLGGASLNSRECFMDGDPSTDDCDAPGYFRNRLEGIDVGDDRAIYGGSEDASSCGTLRYVRIEFAGAELSPDNELNGLTVAGCGSGTTLSHIQVHRGKDDGVEFFGGTASLDHVIISGPSDDGLDCDEGWRGTGQFIVVHQFAGIGDNAIECDSFGGNELAEPRTDATLSNITLVGAGEGRIALLREGMRGQIVNAVSVDFAAPVDLRAADNDLSAEWPGELGWESSYFFSVGEFPTETGEDDDDNGFDEAAAFTDAARMNDFDTDPMLADTSVTAPDYTPGVALEGVAPSFGDTSASYAGAFESGGANWAEGWTAFPLD